MNYFPDIFPRFHIGTYRNELFTDLALDASITHIGLLTELML